MKVIVRYVILSVLGIGILVALFLTIHAPLIYSLEQDTFPSRFHDNTDVLKIQVMNSTTDLMPVMQDLVDFTGPISLNIRIHDLDQARRDLTQFSKSQGTLNNLVVRLDMNESEIQDLSRSTARQNEIFQELINAQISLDTLQSLEIQFRDENNRGMLTSIALQGDALQKKVQTLNERYQRETNTVINIGTKYGLNTTQASASATNVEQYTHDVVEGQVARIQDTPEIIELPIYRGNQLTLLIYPLTSRYRDTIECMGSAFTINDYRAISSADVPVTLYVDGVLVTTVRTDANGTYSFKLPIERMRAGTHAMYAQSNDTVSEFRNFIVLPVNSVTTIQAGRPDAKGNVTVTGNVMANQPVRFAPVQIICDLARINTTMTDANGRFAVKVPVPVGQHILIARFTGEGFPINSSESAPVTVKVSLPLDLSGLVVPAVIIGILCLSGAGSFYYLRRMNRRSSKASEPVFVSGERPPEPEDEVVQNPLESPAEKPDREITAMDSPLLTDESLVARYTRMLQDQGLSAAARLVYQQFAAQIAHDQHIAQYQQLTPREMSRNCREKPYCATFTLFVSVYEGIRYGGQKSAKNQTEFETVTDTTKATLEGDTD